MLLFTAAAVVIALLVFVFSKKVYEGRMQIVVGFTPTTRNVDLLPDVQEFLDSANARDTESEVQVLSGEALFDEAAQNVATRQGQKLSQDDLDNLFQMYDVLNDKETAVADVRVRAYSPETAADIANEVGAVYNKVREREAMQVAQAAKAYLEQQVAEAKQSMDKAEDNLKTYKLKNGVMDPTVAFTNAQNQYSADKLSLNNAQSDLQEAEGNVSTLTSQLSTIQPKSVASSTTVKNPVVQNLENDLSDLEAKRDETAAQYDDNSTQVRAIDREIAGAKARLKAENDAFIQSEAVTADNPNYQAIQQQLVEAFSRRDGLVRKVAQLQALVASEANQVGNLPDQEAEIKQLSTEEDLAEQKYRSTKDELEHLTFKTQDAGSAAQIPYPATPIYKPVQPSLPRLILIGIVAGMMLGLLYSYVLEALKLRVYNSTQLTELTGLPVVAAVPKLPRQLVRRMKQSVLTDNAAVLEPYRFMAFSVLSGAPAKPKMVLVTGVGGMVGATTASAQLGLAAAKTGAQVVILDFDLQFAALSRMFGLAGESGIREILNRNEPGPCTSGAHATHNQNLRIVPAGNDLTLRAADVPFEKLCGLIAAYAQGVDLLIIDAPPVDRVSDAARMVACVDEVCLVVSASNTNYRHILKAQDILRRAGAKQISLVLSGASEKDEPFTHEASAFVERA